MKYLASIIVVLALCTHCTEARPPEQHDGLKMAGTNTAVGQKKERLVIPGKSGAQKAFVDPETGEFVTPEKDEATTTNMSVEFHHNSTSVEEMEEKSSPVPGGGMMIDLKGRFQNPLSATIEGDGKTKIEHPVSDKME